MPVPNLLMPKIYQASNFAISYSPAVDNRCLVVEFSNEALIELPLHSAPS
jgi:hypothetical protein